MFEQLMQMIQQSGQQAVVENKEVPNENNDAILNEAQNTITSSLADLQNNGQLNTLMDSFQNDPAAAQSHPAVQNISNNFMGSIMEKFGLNKATAASIAAAIIPMVLSQVMNKGGSQQSGGGFDLGGLLSSLTGGNNTAAAPGQQGQGGGIMDTLSNLGAKFGMDKDGDGDVDMNDITKMIK